MARSFDRLVALGELKDGTLVFRNPRWVKGMLKQYADCKIRVVFEKMKREKSKEQLGYLWGVVYPEISRHTGHSPEELHEIFKSKFLREKKVWRGSEITTLGSISQMTTGELAEFITNVILEAGELGIEVPPADPAYQFKD